MKLKQTKYKHIFFDLDQTLWDFHANSVDTLHDIFDKYELTKYCAGFEAFYEIFRRHNDHLWELYRQGKIKKEVLSVKRFMLVLKELGVDNENLAQLIAKDYITISPTKKQLIPFAHEILEYLQPNYQLHIITNGFNEVQFIKLDNSDLRKYFTRIITSEEVGFLKPNPEVFKYALKATGAKHPESLMIGDDINIDVLGAKHCGIDQVFFNPNKTTHFEEITHEIHTLEELKGIL